MTQERTDGAAVERTPQATDNAEPAGGSASLDKVREILFGSQSRDYEKRFARLEDRLVKESDDLKDEVRRRFEALEAFIKRELEAVSERMKAEQDERRDADRGLERELRERAEAFVRKTEQLDDLINRAQRELREQLLNQSRQLSDDIRQSREQSLQVLKREAAELRSEKTDRAALAAMFTELAMRLNGEGHVLDLAELNKEGLSTEGLNNG